MIGKPEPGLYHEALARLPRTARRILAIGDNPATDGAGARRMGLDCALVGPLAERYPDLEALLEEAVIRTDPRDCWRQASMIVGVWGELGVLNAVRGRRFFSFQYQ